MVGRGEPAILGLGSSNREKVVRNLSNRALTEEEKEVLALGLNFAITPKQIRTHPRHHCSHRMHCRLP